MSRKRRVTKAVTVDYFAELRKAFPDDVPITCPGCDTPGEPHKAWCDQRHTVTLTRAEDVRHFEEGPNILDMPEEEARAILGSEVYDTLMEAKNDPSPRGICIVTAIGADKEQIPR
jgi:hypothetical protein